MRQEWWIEELEKQGYQVVQIRDPQRPLCGEISPHCRCGLKRSGRNMIWPIPTMIGPNNDAANRHS